MTVQYAAEKLGDAGIRVNSVQPGILDNELIGAEISFAAANRFR